MKDGDIISLLCTKHEEKGKFRLQFPDPDDNSQPVTTDFEQTLAVSDLDILIDCIGDSQSQSRKNSSNLSSYMQREIRESGNNTNVKEAEPDTSVDKTIDQDSQKNKHEAGADDKEREEKEMSVHEDDEINIGAAQNNNANSNNAKEDVKEENNINSNHNSDNKTELMQVEEVKLTGRKRKAPSKRQHRKKINDEGEDSTNNTSDNNNANGEDEASDVNEYSDGEGSPDTRHRRKRQRLDRLAENLMNLNEKTEDQLEAKGVNMNKNNNEGPVDVDHDQHENRDFSKEVNKMFIAFYGYNF